jgi:membrane-bound serine protease (ClpP class)
VVCAGLAGLVWGPSALGQEPEAFDEPAKAAIVTLEGSIDGLTERTLELRIKRALESNPQFLIVSIDSGGGELVASRNLAWNLHNLEQVTTVAFVRAHALSGATMVAFGCDLIAMAPGGQLGDAMPLEINRATMTARIAEKLIAPVRKDLRDLAELQGYPGEVAEAMVDPGMELHMIEVKDPTSGRIHPRWLSRESLDALPYSVREALVHDEVVSPEGKLLVISPDDAEAMGIARLVAKDEAELCEALAAEFSYASVTPLPVEDLWWSSVVRLLTWWPVKTFLFVIGVVALAVAFGSPGMGVPELVAAGCLGAVFFGSYLIGLSDYIEPLIFVVGAGLLLAELLTPTFGLLGIAGIVLMSAAFLLSFQTFGIPTDAVQWDQFQANLGKTMLGGAGSVFGLMAALRFLPQTRLLGRLVHEHTQEASQETTTEARHAELAPAGSAGVTHTVLRPVGRVRIGDETFEAVAEGGYIDEGATVVVVAHKGGELVVAARPEATPLTPSEESPP